MIWTKGKIQTIRVYWICTERKWRKWKENEKIEGDTEGKYIKWWGRREGVREEECKGNDMNDGKWRKE